MNEKQFQRKYHDYVEQDKNKTIEEAKKVNRVAVGFTVAAVKMGNLGYCLMLSNAYDFLKEMNE